MAFIAAVFGLLCAYVVTWSFRHHAHIELDGSQMAQVHKKVCPEDEMLETDVTADIFGNVFYPKSYDVDACSPFELLEINNLRG